MPFAPKNPFTRFPTLPTLVTLAAGGAALAVPFYRRPIETVTNLARISMLLRGVREETCDVDGFRIHYYHAGRRGTPLIFIHGLGASAESWALLMPRLSQSFSWG